ncbi:MAG: hypothetical protein KAT46_00470 [Deltaproteobacteria bacterium]|nr:hypothetical protein [Deltaproteobacteria bacterium]
MKTKTYITILALFFIWATGITNTLAETEPVHSYYDEQNDWFVFEWTDPDLGKQSSILDKGNKVKPIINAKVELQNDNKTYVYNYQVSNQEGALQPVQIVQISFESEVYDAKTPSPKKDWYMGQYRGKDVWRWSKTDGTVVGIPPGETESGFSFKSKGIPTIVKSIFFGKRRVRYSGPGDSDPIEIDDSFERAYLKFKENYKDKFKTVRKKTVGPGKLPEKFNATDFIDHLIDLKHQAQDLGWIKAEGGDGIIQALDQKLDNAKAAIARGNTRSATKILKAFIKQVEAQSCKTHDNCKAKKHLSPEAYALLKYNAEYLLENL